MAGGQWVPKQALIDQIRRTMIDGGSGAFTILTDQRRSIMFRFSEGKLIHSHCRSRDVQDAIEVLAECTELKFSQSTAQPKEQQELISADAFLQALAPDELIAQPVANIPPPPAPMPKTKPLVELADSPVGVRSEAFSKRVAELEGGAAGAHEEVAPELEEENKPVKTDHRLFF